MLELPVVWERYETLTNNTITTIPQSYLSRRSTFKDKLQLELIGVYNFYQPLNKGISERNTMLIPTQLVHTTVAKFTDENQDDEELFTPFSVYRPGEDIFLSLVHVALKVRGDIEKISGHKGMSVSEEEAVACVPESLYMLLRLIF